MNKASKRRSVKGRIREYFVLGTERRRNLYAEMARLRNPFDLKQRIKLARTMVPPAERKLPKELGYRTFAAGTLPYVDDIITDVQQKLAHTGCSELGQNKKKQLRTGLLDQQALSHGSPLIKFALDPDLVTAVSDYLGIVPILSNIDLWYSLHAGTVPSNSQLYHCDWIDRTQVKVFIFCSEVTSASGPLVLLDAATSSKIRSRTKYTFGGDGARRQDDEIETLLGSATPVECVGPAGTVSLVDTSRCFHYGSRLQEGAPPRLIAMLQYLTPLAFQLDGKKRKLAPFRRLSNPDLSEAQHMVLGEHVTSGS